MKPKVTAAQAKLILRLGDANDDRKGIGHGGGVHEVFAALHRKGWVEYVPCDPAKEEGWRKPMLTEAGRAIAAELTK